MADELNRRLSSTHGHRPRKGDVPKPEIEEISTQPRVYDSRYMAWRIHQPNHVQVNDPDLISTGRGPRQQRLDSCNILQLYSHIEYYLARHQMKYRRVRRGSKIIRMENTFLIPQAGWKLFDETTQLEYVVKSVLQSEDVDGKKTFSGDVVLNTEAPEEGHALTWLDPYGEAGSEPKLIRMIHQEELRSLIEPQTASDGGDVADVRSPPFTPVFGYSLIRHEPGSLDNHPFGPNREIKPRVRMTARDPFNPGIHQRVYGWWMDTIIQFSGYAVGGKAADRLSVWLRNFFRVYTSALKLLGVQEVLYWGTTRDKEETRTAYDLSVRNVQYYFRLEEIEVELEGDIQSVDIDYQVLAVTDPIPWVTSEPEPPAFPTDTSGMLPLYGAHDIGDDY